jgi:DNA gyrase subunit A
MSAYDRSRRDGLIAINLRDGDSLIAVRRVKTGEKVMMVSSAGRAIKWDEKEARPMGRDTMGVIGMAPADDAIVVGMEIAPTGSELFVITQNGYGKRTPCDDYPEHHRGGQGVKTIRMTEKKGQLAGRKVIMPGQELMIISEEGVVIRVKSSDISQLGRDTQGVRVMNVSDTDHVTAIARVAGSQKKKRPASEGMEGQTSLFDERDPEVADVEDDDDIDDDLADDIDELEDEE